MKKLIFFLMILPLLSMKPGSKHPQDFRPGKDLAVFFAIEKYQNPKLGNLQNPVRNAYDIAAELKNRFGFDTEVLENPSQAEIIGKLKDLERLYARNEDGQHAHDGQLLLFFSGHGMSEDENGYFMPADADPTKPYEKGIAYEIWRPKINKINCRHILVAIDACYSVRFDPDWKNKTDGNFHRPGEMTDSERALANYETYKARVFFTSDNKEDQTPDRSNFAKKMLEGLRSGAGKDGFVTSKQLFANYIEGAIPTPRAGTFGDDEASSAFLFYGVKKVATASSISEQSDADDRAFLKAQRRGEIQDFEDYLEVFQEGKHREAAENAIITIQKRGPEPAGVYCKDTFRVVIRPGDSLKLKASSLLSYEIDNLAESHYSIKIDRIAPFGNGPWISSPVFSKDQQVGFKVSSSHTGNMCKGVLMVENDRAPLGFVLVKGGTFQMGSQDGKSDEKPTHSINISDFYLGKYEVTVAEFRNFIEATNYQTDAEKKGGEGSFFTNAITKTWELKTGINWRHDAEGNLAEDNHPVVHVSWDDATAYCKWLSQKSGNKYRLPTEAEWEYAAGNGTSHTKYCWGNAEPFGGNGGNVADETAAKKFNWLKNSNNIFVGYSDGFPVTSPVGSFNPSALGLYDMTGNVWEWCSDWYDVDYYRNSPSNNPVGPSTGSSRVQRGGAWFNDPQECRVAHRINGTPGFRCFYSGFRLAISFNRAID